MSTATANSVDPADLDRALSRILDQFRQLTLAPSPGFRRWLSGEGVGVYVRVILHRELMCVEVGGVEFARMGEFFDDRERLFIQRLLAGIHERHQLRATSIENVMDPALAGWLLLNGWVVTTVQNLVAQCFYLDRKNTFSWREYSESTSKLAQSYGKSS